MTKTMTVLAVAIGVSLGSASSVSAQTGQSAQAGQSPALPPEYFINVNVGAQQQRRTVTAPKSFRLYDEDAKLTTNYHIRNGVMYEIAVGKHVWRNLTLGVSFSAFDKSGTGDTDAIIPNPLFYDRPIEDRRALGSLAHRERAVHVMAAWWLPVTDKIDVSIAVGPSFIRVSQGVAKAANVVPQTQTIASFAVETQSGTAVGFNAGFDGTYMFTRRYGAGLFVRYAGGTVDLTDLPGLRVGGVQAGLGIRVRF